MFDLFFSFTDVATVKRTKKREGTSTIKKPPLWRQAGM